MQENNQKTAVMCNERALLLVIDQVNLSVVKVVWAPGLENLKTTSQNTFQPNIIEMLEHYMFTQVNIQDYYQKCQ